MATARIASDGNERPWKMGAEEPPPLVGPGTLRCEPLSPLVDEPLWKSGPPAVEEPPLMDDETLRANTLEVVDPLRETALFPAKIDHLTKFYLYIYRLHFLL
jgi:hypothetical protein